MKTFNRHLLCAIFIFFACAQTASESYGQTRAKPTRQGIAFFERHVRPLLIAKCYKCHSRKAKKKSGGLWLDSQAAWLNGGDSGAAIVPGKPTASLLIKAVRYDDTLQMPPDKQLSKRQIALLEAWVKMGAPAPRTAGAVAGVRPADPVAGRKHWAFQPLKRHRLPAIHNTRWPRQPLDRFVLHRLERRKLKPAKDADRRTWLRRVHFDLTGLLPSPTVVKAFLADRSDDAREQLVDRLLSSPRFGERWGRHWLDLARYADSNGLDENFLFRNAWRFRNWVLKEVNRDTPYDKFLHMQIAGDHLSYKSIEQRDQQRIGTGFLVVGPKVLLGVPSKRQDMEVADEIIDTIGRTVLAQTLGCARCHDHKFDPFPTADYYALAGIFTSTQVMERRRLRGGSTYRMERLAGLGGDGPKLDDAYEKYYRELPTLKKRITVAESILKAVRAGKPIGSELLADKKAFDPIAVDNKKPQAARVKAQEQLVTKLKKLVSAPKLPLRAMIAEDIAKPADEAIRISGVYTRKGKVVPRGFLQVLQPSQKSKSTKLTGSGRLELARWLTSDEGAGHLAARVMVNRIWHHLFGRGFVRTVDNFGRRGELPTHPALLDHLASRFIANGWSVKFMIREVVLSRTYAMSSQFNAKAHRLDPENKWLWRANRRRLDPESLRDNILKVAGGLDLQTPESTVDYLADQATAVGRGVRRRTDYKYRAVFLPVIRNDLPELFDVFDFANPHATTGARTKTTLPTQGLFMLNDEQIQAAAGEVAKELIKLPSPQRIDRVFELIVGVPPTKRDKAQLRAFVDVMNKRFPKDKKAVVAKKTWTLLVHALFASSRFQFVE